MKTYVLEVDGTPKIAFRAKDDKDAARWPNEWLGIWCVRAYRYQGTLAVRPATIPEQAAWRSHSVDMCGQSDDAEFERDPELQLLLLDTSEKKPVTPH
jgi:hypothetical protein